MSCNVEKQRLIYVDIIKIVAIIGVILIHVCAKYWYNTPTDSNRFEAMNFWNAIGRFAVPCFVMCSGILFLKKKELTYKDIFVKYIPRIVIAFAVWTIVYALIKTNCNIIETLILLTKRLSSEHLWFMIMIIGLYVITPIIRIFIKNARKIDIQYFLIIAFAIQFVIPFLIQFESLEFLKVYYNYLYPTVVTGYIGYYVLGYYLNEYGLSKKQKIAILFTGILSIIVTVLLNLNESRNEPKPVTTFFNELYPTIAFYSMLIFILMKEIVTKIKVNEIASKPIAKVGSLVFGIYLVHAIFINILDSFNINALMCNTYIAIPVTTLLVFICSLVSVHIISKIPILRKTIL